MSTGTPRAQAPASPVRFRRNVDRLTAGQLGNLRSAFEAVYALTDDRGYAHHAGIHGLPLPIGCDNAHGTPYFLPWHRAYLYFFERALRDRVPRAMLTWWDWRTGPQRPAQVPQAFRSRTVGGRTNALHSARVSRLALEQGRRAGLVVGARTRREPGDAALFPRAAEVRQVLELRDFLDFSFALEGLHARLAAQKIGPPASLSQAVTGSSRRVRRPSLRMGEGGPTGPRSQGAIRRCQPEGQGIGRP